MILSFTGDTAPDIDLPFGGDSELVGLSDHGRMFLQTLQHAFLNARIKNIELSLSTLSDPTDDEGIGDAIAHARAHAIVHAILTGGDRHIFLLADFSQLNNIIRALQDADPRYAVTDTRYIRPIE